MFVGLFVVELWITDVLHCPLLAKVNEQSFATVRCGPGRLSVSWFQLVWTSTLTKGRTKRFESHCTCLSHATTIAPTKATDRQNAFAIVVDHFVSDKRIVHIGLSDKLCCEMLHTVCNMFLYCFQETWSNKSYPPFICWCGNNYKNKTIWKPNNLILNIVFFRFELFQSLVWFCCEAN